MNKKIIFIGPSGAGKTTIRKMFFEGENSKKLLEYALEPTYGEESLILRLPGINENIGIFDLAGQENHRWLETDENSIFVDSKLILVVIDISSDFGLISEFIRKIVDIRDQLSPNSMIYVLLHKIDLIDDKKFKEVKTNTILTFSDTKLFKIKFTSLKKKYLVHTFSDFLEIMKSCLIEEDSEDALEFNVIDESIKIISEIKNQISISKKVLIEKLNRPEKLVNYLIESLEKKNHISIQDLENDEVISLTDFGKDYFSNILKSFSSKLIVENENLVKSNKNLSPEEIPSFIGALISDKDGRTLLKIELNEDYLKKFLFKRENLDPSSILADLDLIPMFISALEKFSMELNIHDLSGFNLSGSNLKLNIISYDLYNVILFMNPDVNIDPLKIRIQNYFNNIFDEHNELFNKCLKTGQTDLLSPILKETKNWLEDINKTYQNMIINLEIIDIEHAKRLYDQIDNLYEKVSQTFGITLDKIKKLKVNLMKAILEKNYEELISISNHAKKLSLKFAA